VSKFVGQTTDELNRMAEERKKQLLQIKSMDEAQAVKETKSFLEKEFNAKVEVYGEEETRDMIRSQGLSSQSLIVRRFS